MKKPMKKPVNTGFQALSTFRVKSPSEIDIPQKAKLNFARANVNLEKYPCLEGHLIYIFSTNSISILKTKSV